MAVELARFLSDQLSRLPEHHPDRRFLAGLQEAVGAYTDQVAPERIALAVGDEAGLSTAARDDAAGARARETGENAGQAGAGDQEDHPHLPGAVSGVSGGRTHGLGSAAESEKGEQQEKQRRVRLSGLVAAPPDFRTTPRGIRVGHFPLATHPTPEATTYYEVYAFNKDRKPLADRLRELALTKGQAVEVIGFEHVVTETRRDGSPKPNHIYLAAPVKRKQAPEAAG